MSVSTNFFIWCVCFSSSLFTVGEPQKNKELCAAARYTHTHTLGGFIIEQTLDVVVERTRKKKKEELTHIGVDILSLLL